MSRITKEPIALGSWVMYNNKYYVVWAINTRQHINSPNEIKYTYDIYNEETNDYVIGISCDKMQFDIEATNCDHKDQ